jgi:hypothetical protein
MSSCESAGMNVKRKVLQLEQDSFARRSSDRSCMLLLSWFVGFFLLEQF